MPLTGVGIRMADDKQGRVAQARSAERRRWAREIEEARSRSDETEPTTNEDAGSFRPCHRSDCDRTAMFYVLERYAEAAGGGVVEETANLCRQHSADERPMHLESVHDNYVFRIEQLPELTVLDES
jgi:hypothetical protein